MKIADFRSNKGVTLIALVVTIIILMILAGISLIGITDEDGILIQTDYAKDEAERANEREILDIAIIDVMGKNKFGEVDEEGLGKKLEELTKGDIGESDVESDYDDEGEECVVVTFKSENKYLVYKNGEVTVDEDEDI